MTSNRRPLSPLIRTRLLQIERKLTAVSVSPNVETVRTECGSVEVAFDAERADSTPGFPEVKQEYVTRRF